MLTESPLHWAPKHRPGMETTHYDERLEYIAVPVVHFLETGKLDPSLTVADQRIPAALGFTRGLRMKHHDLPGAVIFANGIGMVSQESGDHAVRVDPPDFTRTISDVCPRFGTVMPLPDGSLVTKHNKTPLGVCGAEGLEKELHYIETFAQADDLPFDTPRLLAAGRWSGSPHGWAVTLRPDTVAPIKLAQNSGRWAEYKTEVARLMEAVAILHQRFHAVHLQLHGGNWEKAANGRIFVHDFETMTDLDTIAESGRQVARRQDLYSAIEASAELMTSRYVAPAIVDRSRSSLVQMAVTAYRQACGEPVYNAPQLLPHQPLWRQTLSQSLDGVRYL